MPDEQDKVGPLKEILLGWEADLSSGPDRPLEENPPIQFIYGIGPTGLAPLECKLAEKTVGETISLLVKRDEFANLFGHLPAPPGKFPEGQEDISLRLKILSIGPADQRKVVKAIAEMAGCGEHCCGH